MSWIDDVRSKLAALDPSRRALVKFGLTMGIAFVVLGAVVFIFGSHPERGYALAGIGLLFLLFAWIAPAALRPVRKGWMAFAFALGWVMSRVILTVFFFIAVTPVGLIMRLLGRDPLEIRAVNDSYWIPRERKPREAKDYERLF
jgi:hypothetical protein